MNNASRVRRLALAAMAAFAFGCAAATAAAAVDPCTQCELDRQRCVDNGGTDCESRAIACLKLARCPL